MPNARRPITDTRQIQMICAALIFANLPYIAVAVVLYHAGSLPAQNQEVLEPGTGTVLTYALLTLGISATVLSFILRMLLRSRLTPPVEVPRIATACIVPAAIAESAGAMGLVVALLIANWPLAGLLWGISIGAGILHYPTSAWLDSLRDR